MTKQQKIVDPNNGGRVVTPSNSSLSEKDDDLRQALQITSATSTSRADAMPCHSEELASQLGQTRSGATRQVQGGMILL